MRGINKAIVLGRCGKDPEVRYTASGKAVANLSLATSEEWKDKEGKKTERTEWHNLVFFDKLAEIVGQYVKKGDLLYTEGKINTRKWQDKQGQDRYSTEIVVSDMQMLGAKSGPKQPAQHELDLKSGGGQLPRGQSEFSRAEPDVQPESDEDIPF